MADDPRKPGPDGWRDGAPLDETISAAEVGDTREHKEPFDAPAAPKRADGGGDRRTPPERWHARAAVPPERAALPEATRQWAHPSGDEPGRWWMPILVGVVALVLLGVLGFGLWLIASADDEAPAPVRPTASSTVPVRPSPTATKAPPSTEPARVAVPDLVGLTVEEAQDQLDQVGLAYRISYRPDDAEPGTVLATVPDAGSRVAPGAQIRLIVASTPEVTELPAPTPPPTAAG